jgi:hypothetical protein
MGARGWPATLGRALPDLVSRCLLALAGCFCLGLCGGCSQTGELAYAKLARPYQRTQLQRSNTLEVLALADSDDYRFDPNGVGMQLLSQSDTIVAMSGQSIDGRKTWVNLVAFDRQRMTARRKYFFCSDECAVVTPLDVVALLGGGRKGLMFDAQLVLDSSIRATPYATGEARQAAIVRWVAEQFEEDVRRLTDPAESSIVADALAALAGMMMKQAFQGVLLTLDKSPGLARDLGNTKGVAFPHINMDGGRIQMFSTSNAVAVRIRVNLPLDL